MAQAETYTAFISYSHADEAAAQRIHRALETYRVPKRLVGVETPKGRVPVRLGRCFRDRDDLAASGDLSVAVREALTVSENLIVLCSPSAANSRWVNAEIEAFRALHPERDIFVAILDGEPNAEDPERECYPVAIRAADGAVAEPGGADFRPEGDGRQMGLVKLVAGLLGLPLDQIIQRDLQRRNRRVMAVTVMAACSALVLSGLTLFALTGWSEAEQRKAEAEDLIEFMLNDLRDRLAPVGRLDVLDAVGAKVLEYYADQSAGMMTPDSLGRQSRAYLLLGEIDTEQGNLEAAERHFRNAYQSTQQILAVDPDEPARIYEHSQSAYWVGYFAYREGNLDAAETRFLEYLDLTTQLNTLEPGRIDWRNELAYARSNLGTLYMGQRRYDEALQAFTAALDDFTWLHDAQPDSGHAARELADAWGWMVRILEVVEGPDAAIAALREQVNVYGTIDDLERDWPGRRAATIAEFDLARLLLITGVETPAEQVEEATGILEAASFEVDAMIEYEPGNARWFLVGVSQRLWLARARLYAGDLAGAREAYLDASAMMSHPTWQSAEGVAFDSARMGASLIEARILIESGEYEQAEDALTPLINTLALTERWSVSLDNGPYYYAAASNLLAEIYDAQGRTPEAHQVRELMVEHLTPVRGDLQSDALAQYERAAQFLAEEAVVAE